MSEVIKEERRPKIYAIDFDGTIVKNKWPEIGEPVKEVVDFILGIQERDDEWILLTMREGEKLQEAIEWCIYNGLTPTAINDNVPRMKEFFKNNPRKIFANCYIDDNNAGGVYLPPLDGKMDFGSAIRALKAGEKVAREGWNGKGMYLWLVPASYVKKEWCRDKGLLEAIGDKDGIHCNGHIRMYCADGSITSGWVPSQVDILAEDWTIVKVLG